MASTFPLTKETVATLTVAHLRQELSKRSLPVAGLKSALVQRLEEALENEGPDSTSHTMVGENRDDICDSPEDERGHKRKRVDDPEMTDVSEPTDTPSPVVQLAQELRASHKERERLQFQLEEANEKIAAAKQEGKREAYQEIQKELAEMRGQLDVAHRKREELEFKLSQKDEELQEHAANKHSEKQNTQHLKALKEETKKRETVQFQCEQLKDQLDDYKQQVRVLQQKIETHQIHTEREKKENSRSLLEERGKAESIRVRMESQRDELMQEWRREFDNQIERERAELQSQLRDTRKLQKELKEKTAHLEAENTEKLRAELERLAEMQADLAQKENQLRENDTLQEELDVALEQRQRTIDAEAARLESDKQEFEENKQALEKEKQEFEERLWTIERDVKRRREKEKALDDQVMELLAKNESLHAEHARTKDNLLQQIKLLTLDNERLQTSLALSQARVVSARGTASAAPAQATPATQDERKEEEKPPAQTLENGTAETTNSGRLTRSQSQQIRSTQERTQEQQTREILLTKTRSRPSYIPKPTVRKETVSLTPRETKESTQNNNKENTHNSNSTSAEEAPQVRKTRASMIPIRKGSSLIAPQVKALRS